jgi:mannose-6-phosphate isomerase-like protein (cupin superfamily)
MNYEKEADILNCLMEYLPKINAKREFPLSLSNYRVEKPWGEEVWLDLNNYYAFKIIKMNAGCQSSLQSHQYKVEANYIVEGKAKVLLEDEEGVMQSYEFGPGEGWTVPVGRKHRVIAITTYTALEVSSPNLNDVIRYNDEFGRGDGKVESEHSV